MKYEIKINKFTNMNVGDGWAVEYNGNPMTVGNPRFETRGAAR